MDIIPIGLYANLYRRLTMKAERKDFLTNLVGRVKAGEVHLEEMTAHASTLV